MSPGLVKVMSRMLCWVLPLCVPCLAYPMTSDLDHSTIEASGFDWDGVRLVSPSAADFDSQVATITESAGDPVLSLKPFLVIVSNESKHKIVAFSVLWTFTDHGGTSWPSFIQFKYPDALAGISGTGRDAWALENINNREILPGEKRIVSLAFAVERPKTTVEHWRKWLLEMAKYYHDAYAGMEQLAISLDAVIFDDGTLVGPDGSDLMHHFSAYLDAKQSAFRKIVKALDSGKSIDDAFAVIGPSDVSRADLAARGQFAIYEGLAAQEIYGLRQRVGDQALPALVRKAIRNSDFVVHRNDGTKKTKGDIAR